VRIGVDTGGTFTDVVVEDGGRLAAFKVPSTPCDPAAAVLAALEAAAGDDRAGSPRSVVHGSTVATNALLEGKTARAALLTTQGFEDVLEIGRQARPSLYEIEVARPRPLVPRGLRFGIPERVLASGEVRAPLDAAAVRAAAEACRREGVASVAVCFLHAYLRPDHEEAAGRLLREILAVPVTVSSALVREFREYERCSTAAVNAAVAPVMGAYLGRLAAAVPGALRIMGGDGGALAPGRAAAEAVRTVLSGPAAGVVAARRAALAEALGRIVSLDMGGTSTDVALLSGEVPETGEAVVAGHPIRTPVLDIHTVGAGGGSVAWIDAGGALKVGPASAGADPGPACYGRGGPPTVTDANLVLGRILPGRFLDGRMPLDPGAAARAVSAIAGRLGVGLEEAAAGILEVACVTMARAIRQVSLFRGHDPGDFVLCAFGGAGGLHAADLLAAAGIPSALVPPGPGVLSAWGLLASDVVVSRSATVLRPASALRGEALEAAFRPLEASALAVLSEESAAGGPGGVLLDRRIDARYAGQSHELTVPAGDGWAEAFHALHRSRFGFDRRDEAIVAVTLRVAARLPVEEPPLPDPWTGPPESPPSRPHRVWDGGAWREGVAVERSSLRPGAALRGPAVVTEAGGTTYVPAGCAATVTARGAIRLEAVR
jgi:N-methylhydantoinase A